MLISVHLPKTAGSSFLASIRAHFGPALFEDYGDRPINRRAVRRKAHALAAGLYHVASPAKFDHVECIHGHFMPLKYRALSTRKPLRFVTWLRHPVERLASHYYYWMRNPGDGDIGALHRRVIEEQWSLERFCLGPELRNTYCKFLWGFPLDAFDFIGITEHFEQDMARFATDILGESVAVHQDNVNPERPEESYIEDLDLRRRIETFHAADMALYYAVLANNAA